MPWGRFLDPKNNYVFLQVFGTEKNRDILIHFLNDMLGYQGDQKVTEVGFLPTSQDPIIAIYRQSIVDVVCTNQNGEKFIVEMQVSPHKGFEKRAQYYAAKAYTQQELKQDADHKKMEVYNKLKGVIFLAIADFIMFPDKKAWESEHKILDLNTHEHDLQGFHFMFVELEKFHKKLDELETIKDKWVYFFKHAKDATLEEVNKLIGDDKIIERAFEAVDMVSWPAEELYRYEQAVKRELDNIAVEQQKIEDAETRGEARGKAEGIAEGEARGEARGKAEGMVEVAKAMLLDGDSPEKIAKITGLSKAEIEKLKS